MQILIRPLVPKAVQSLSFSRVPVDIFQRQNKTWKTTDANFRNKYKTLVPAKLEKEVHN